MVLAEMRSRMLYIMQDSILYLKLSNPYWPFLDYLYKIYCWIVNPSDTVWICFARAGSLWNVPPVGVYFPWKRKKKKIYQEQLSIRGFEQYVTETRYPPRQKMICIKTICGSTQEWHADVFLHSRRSARFQWCKGRQISPVKGDLQMVL